MNSPSEHSADSANADEHDDCANPQQSNNQQDQNNPAEQEQPSIQPGKLVQIVEAALLATDRPLTLHQLNGLFAEGAEPGNSQLKEALALLDEQCRDRGIELVEVASGFRLQVKTEYQTWISRLWKERPKKYSRALLETLALIAYRQPITRAEIEDVRGVSVSSSIIQTLQERDWIRELGYRDVPGRPTLLGTTKNFLDHFGLQSLEQLPSLAEIQDIESLEPELAFNLQQNRSSDPQDSDSDAAANDPADDEAADTGKQADLQADDSSHDAGQTEDTAGETAAMDESDSDTLESRPGSNTDADTSSSNA